MVMLRFKTLSARDRHRRNPRKKNYREHSNIKKRACQCTDGLSATQNGRGIAETQHHAGIEHISPDSLRPALTTQPLVRIQKRYMIGHITWTVSQPATAFWGAELSISDSSGWISRPGRSIQEMLRRCRHHAASAFKAGNKKIRYKFEINNYQCSIKFWYWLIYSQMGLWD